MQTRLFVLKAVGKKSSNQMDDKIGGTAVTRMLNLRNILELVNNGLNDRSFAQQQFVRKGHKMIFHVLAQSGDELEPLFKEQLRQGSGNVAAISKELAAQSFHHAREPESRSSTLPGVRQHASSSPRSLTARCSLKP